MREMASVVLTRSFAAAGLVAVGLGVGAGVAWAGPGTPQGPSCATTTNSQSNALTCAPTAITAPTSGAPSEQDLTQSHGTAHH